MKMIAPLVFGLLFCAAAVIAGGKSIYDFTLNSIDGQPTSLASYKGKVVMLVNVASRCGFTPQYTALESTYEKFKDKGFVIVGIPANNFGGQEPGHERGDQDVLLVEIQRNVSDDVKSFGEGRRHDAVVSVFDG